MPAKIVRTGADALDRMLIGLDLVADLVATTMGPEGRAVLVGRPYAEPILLRNGYAVSRRLALDDRSVQMGVQAMRELAWRTSDAVGDGTSSTILMARRLVHDLRRALASGLTAVALDRSVADYTALLTDALDDLGRPVGAGGEITRIATEAAGGDAVIGARIGEAFDRVGQAGVVRVEASVGLDDASEFRMGMSFDGGLASPAFAGDPVTGSVSFENPLLVLHRGPIADLRPLVAVLETMAKAGRPLVIVADNFEGDALTTLVLNKTRNGLKVAAVTAPEAGLWRHLVVDDLAIATGATVIDPVLGTSLAHLRPAMAGQAGRIDITRAMTTVTAGRGDEHAIALRAEEIGRAIAREKHLAYDREQHQKRLARFRAGVAIVRFGGAADQEAAQRGERAETAVAAARAALQGGVVPGGAAALIHAHRRARRHLGTDLLGRCTAAIVQAAVEAPLRAILVNGHIEGNSVLGRLWSDPADLCFDVLRRDFVEPAGLGDPLPVVRAALRNAVSCARTLSGASVAIFERRSA